MPFILSAFMAWVSPAWILARHSFDIRKCPQKGCWSQDPIQAAMLGYTGVAAEDVRYA
jgi:hypothetical protein